MTALPFTLIRDDTAGDRCAKCVASSATMRKPATYTLRQGASTWRLCTDHAAASAHALAIRHPTFNPEGKSLVNPKE